MSIAEYVNTSKESKAQNSYLYMYLIEIRPAIAPRHRISSN